MKKQSLLIFLSVLVFSSHRAHAQNTEIFGVFPTIDHSATLTEKWGYNIYYFGAFNLINPAVSGSRERPHMGAVYLEQALNFKLSEGLTLTGSFVYERMRPLQDGYRNENRVYAQATLRYPVNRVHLKHRFRYDGRYIQNRTTGKSPYTHRLRYLMGMSFPFNKFKNIYFSAYNEFFLNLDKGSAPIYGENWAFAGFGLKTGGAGTWEVGPLYIFWALPGEKNVLINFYYLQVAWVTHLDFRKTKST